MALPKLDVPTYEMELPVSKKKIKYRPFLVKEQKNLFEEFHYLRPKSVRTVSKEFFVIGKNFRA